MRHMACRLRAPLDGSRPGTPGYLTNEKDAGPGEAIGRHGLGATETLVRHLNGGTPAACGRQGRTRPLS
jgi:hypothetical protein